ncbi:ABC transporter permease [Aneurinibacillus aneurinilyticus]|uniref:ABC transporter permease n=2 Tax=Aneurinibacillus aneurinilyticus TaxID=1391 RepID=A0A848CRB5_ANEAE|nr:ABC transporter permease [Aneurinibacillus aneurinilyticus]MCI1694411.1 ABC transporter permease [Aneurinibacillus aneurinilyticus]MED0669086.1 ABC transporter permease [Aneurinibacillus aneurinilyticus]MED0706537.1 ABC transporter permease [Aneurinibacillus aneurinilyticus]MED0724398.1 ABC transporter permease [Aneurinibacillus aneurinilyticus]MED0730547.1 ABC transporter permease [Aneurinibacillus aneurinilyticus]
MSSLIRLVRNENMKMYRRISSWILIAVLILLTIGVGLLLRYDSSSDNNEQWRNGLASKSKEIQEVLQKEQNIPQFQRTQMEKEMKIYQYRLDHNFGPSVWNGVKATSSLMSFVTLSAVVIAGGIVASEYNWGTIKLLLIRPQNRTKILLSKYIATMGYALLMIIILLSVSFITNGLLFGFQEMGQPYLYVAQNGTVQEGNMLVNILQTYGLSSVEMIMVVTFAFMMSVVFRSSALAIGLSLFIMFISQPLIQFLSKFSWVKYYLFANTNLSVYLEGTPLIPGMTLTFSLIVLAGYFLGFTFISWFVFKKRDVAA